MIEYLLIGVLIGWFGHGQIVRPPPAPLVVAECVKLTPPADNTFGATTSALVECVGTYRKCSTACLAK